MAKIRFTKAALLRILATEPLRPGEWLARRNSIIGPVTNKDCVGCAVGALFNVCTVVNNNRLDINDWVWELLDLIHSSVTAYNQANKHLKARRYLPALSCRFEGAASKSKHKNNPTECARQNILKWIRAKFPATLTLDINGFEPRTDLPKGVTVVKTRAKKTTNG